MANIVLQHTNRNRVTTPDIYVYDDNTVTETDGTPIPAAVVTLNTSGSIAVSLTGDGVQEIKAAPINANIRITRQPGWQGAVTPELSVVTCCRLL